MRVWKFLSREKGNAPREGARSGLAGIRGAAGFCSFEEREQRRLKEAFRSDGANFPPLSSVDHIEITSSVDILLVC